MLGFCHIVYTATMLFKYRIFANGADPAIGRDWKKRLASLDEHTLPIYTILLPMYDEAASLPHLIEHMRALDYPASKLDIKIILEADDRNTMEAVLALNPPYYFDIICVPPNELRTKPRACNYALRFARGEYVTVFDADDEPEYMQLKKSVYAFRHLPKDVVCLQARLNYYNLGETRLTRLFSLEYKILFHYMLYGLERIGIPIPLGGTSNHISLARLKELGEWDPYNVTEDADLGTRIAALGFRTAMLDSFTREEATATSGTWIRQRSRWIKGYMQTWLVHMRHPVILYHMLGWKSFLGFQFFIGLSTFVFLSAPIVWTISICWWIASLNDYSLIAFPRWLAVLTWSNLAIHLISHWHFSLSAARLYSKKYVASITRAAWLYPLYLALHSIASYRALWQLIFKPHFWEKTSHGLARRTRALRRRKRVITEDTMQTNILQKEVA